MAAARDTAPTGFHLETLVAHDLLVWKDGAPTRDLYHWRLASGQEVDFILEESGKLLPVEVKAAEAVGHAQARHLIAFRDRAPRHAPWRAAEQRSGHPGREAWHRGVPLVGNPLR